MNFFYTFIPNKILLTVFNINIYWYGLFVFIGVLLGFIVFYLLLKKEKIESKNIYDIFFYIIIFGFLGARFTYLFYDLSYYINNPVEIFKFWNGGMSIIGGIIFGFMSLYIICKKRKIDLIKILNIIPIPLLIGQIIGRFGNYFNQELFGLPTSFFLKISIEKINRPTQYADSEFFMPLFLYEIIFNIILLIILLILYKLKNKNNLESGVISKEIKLKDFRKKMSSLVFIEKGGMFFIYINYYFILRFVLEFFRTGEPKVLFFTLNQVISLIIILSFDVYFLTRKK